MKAHGNTKKQLMFFFSRNLLYVKLSAEHEVQNPVRSHQCRCQDHQIHLAEEIKKIGLYKLV